MMHPGFGFQIRHGLVKHGEALQTDDPEDGVIGFPQLSLLQFHPIPYLPARQAQAPPVKMPPFLSTTGLLLISNVFMTFAWYAHLKDLKDKPWWIAALISWGIALLEYMFQVPANRIGYQSGIGLAQLKILQEVITLAVFVPFAVFYMGERPRLDFLWAGLCLTGAVYFIFRGGMGGK